MVASAMQHHEWHGVPHAPLYMPGPEDPPTPTPAPARAPAPTPSLAPAPALSPAPPPDSPYTQCRRTYYDHGWPYPLDACDGLPR